MISPSAVGHGSDLPDLERQSTSAKMEAMATGGPMIFPLFVCMWGACCFWMPLVFYLSAANVLPQCEKDLALFMKVYGLYIFVAAPVFLLFMFCIASCGNKTLFKAYGALVALISAGIAFGMICWGYVLWSGTTTENCYDGEAQHDHPINPRTLCIVFIACGAGGMAENCTRAFTKAKDYATSQD